jgi:hypothetical protein
MFVALTLIASLAGPPHRSSLPHDPSLTIQVDSSHHEVVITAGTFDLPDMPPMDMSNMGMMDHSMSHDTPVQTFQWPLDGWFRGYKLEVIDSAGQPLPRHIMHHLIVINYDRRQLLYSAAERMFGAGTETDDITVPATIGLPLSKGMNLGFYVAWHNDTGRDLNGVRLRITMDYLPTNQNPRPLSVLPIYMDVNNTVGATNTFDVPPGKSTKAYEFTIPISGRLIGYGGHLHDYGVMVRLEDAKTGKELAKVVSTRDSTGQVSKVSQSFPGIKGAGIKLKANHPYRVIAYYDNPTNEVIVKGAMAHISGLFAPDNIALWPKVDLNDPQFQRDLASLEMRGMGGDDHAGHDHGAPEHN